MTSELRDLRGRQKGGLVNIRNKKDLGLKDVLALDELSLRLWLGKRSVFSALFKDSMVGSTCFKFITYFTSGKDAKE